MLIRFKQYQLLKIPEPDQFDKFYNKRACIRKKIHAPIFYTECSTLISYIRFYLQLTTRPEVGLFTQV